jgi:hypothetical protein
VGQLRLGTVGLVMAKKPKVVTRWKCPLCSQEFVCHVPLTHPPVCTSRKHTRQPSMKEIK